MSDTPEQPSLDTMAKVYLKIKGRIQEITNAYESEVETLKAQQDALRLAMKDQLRAVGAKSVNTPHGTVVMSQKTRYYAQDWEAMKTFIVEHGALDLLERRIAQTNMAAFLKENPSTVPPGLNSVTEFDVAVRRPSK
jgi:hypothetical protein